MWEIIPRDEQETIISFDYFEKTMTFYTSRQSVARRLEKKVGEPTKIDMINNKEILSNAGIFWIIVGIFLA